MDETRLKQTVLQGLSSEGLEIKATPLHLSRYLVTFEVVREGIVLKVSEVLTDFKIIAQDRMLYHGRAVIKSVVDTRLTLVCEANLEDSWIEAALIAPGAGQQVIQSEFQGFFEDWQKLYRVSPELKLIVSDLVMFLTDFRLWVDQAEVGIRSMPGGDRNQQEWETAEAISRASFPTLDAMFERFEATAATLDPGVRPVHEVFVRRHLHSLLLCSPFAFRSVQKPLGYAGDYEMVNMILRDPHEGGSLFAKVVNRWFIKQPPALAHRNRVRYLVDRLNAELLRTSAQGGTCRIFNIGCGPAAEIQELLASSPLISQARLHLLDFNEETIEYTRQTLDRLQKQHHRTAQIQFTKKSVVQMLKGRSKFTRGSELHLHDVVYCAGLFDYLPDSLCRQLIEVFYEQAAPGGLVILTNVDPSNPIRHWLAYVLDWHLIYRNANQLMDLCPTPAIRNCARVIADPTGVNLFLEIRRPPE